MVASTLLLGVAVGLSSAPALSAGGTITSRGPAAAATYASDSTTSLTLALPTGAQIGDVLIASLGFGASGATSQPILTAPAGWTLSSRTNHGADGTLAVYWHVLASGETTYTWTTNFRVGGAIFLAAFAGVDTTQPIDVAAGASVARGTSASTPSVTTTAANDALVASYFGYRSGGAGTTWAAPAAMTELGDATNGGSRSGSMDYAFQASAGASGAETATASGSQDYAVATLSALRPAGGTSDTTPPVISGVAAGSVTTTGASISWATDEASDSQVEYGTTTGYGSSTAIDSTAVVSHSRSLSGLTAGTLYHYRVKSRDSAGNLASSPDFTFQTTTAADTTPPVISGVAAGSITTTAASISWSTNEASDSQVEYGTTTAYGSSTAIDSTAVVSHSRSLSALSGGTLYHYRVKSRDAAGNLATSPDFTFQTTSAPGGPVPLIVDTDIFSDADDVGALATAFALQIKGEARVIAIGVNTRTSRPAVATNSWKCAAATAQFYGAGSTPIGTDMPNNGTEVNTADFIGPCSTLTAPGTPTPQSAVSVFRRALVGQADGSVVIAATGYEENLSALLNSPGDSISPLTGRALVAQKVKMLSIMGGGYPSRSGENNLIGNAAAAQNVAANWPTKIVWAGYEVGDAIHTGDTISRTHPSNSPVRVSYEAFVGPNNWIFSYDLVAVYYAVRPVGPVLTEVGPGTNSVNSSGGNTFTLGAGNQYYLKLSNATSLDSSIEALLDTLPSATPPDTTPPVISGVAAGSITSTGASISWATNEASDSQVEYGTTTGYGSSSAIDSTAVISHSRSLSGLTAGTLYHYRVKSRDSAGNLASSPDFTFQTTTAADTTPPVISGVAAGSVTSTGASVSWSTDEASDSQVEYGTTTGYGSSSAIDSTAVLNHSRSLAGLAAGTLYHYRVKSRDAAGNLATSGDFTFQTSTTGGSAGPADTFDSNTLDPARWIATPSGSTVAALNQELEITHPAGAWTKGMLQSATPHDQTGKSLQIQVKRAANGALGGATFGETTIFLWLDATHYVSFFMAGGSLTARVNTGSGEVNLNPAWPAYNAANMQWLRFREASGTLYWEYASGATSPGTWTVLASRADPFALSAVTLRIVAGANTSSADTAKFDNVSTS